MSGVLTVAPNPAKVGDELVATGTGFGTPATLTTALTGTNNDIKFTAVLGGTVGNGYHVVYAVAGNNTALTVTVSGSTITVHVATDGGGAATSTASQVLAALLASAPTMALVTAALATGNDGTGVVTALSSTALAGGADDTVEVEFIHDSGAQDDVRYSEASASGAFTSANNLTYSLETPGNVVVNARVGGVVVSTVEVEVFTSS